MCIYIYIYILLIQFYSAIIESVLCTWITVWFSSAKYDVRRLRRVTTRLLSESLIQSSPLTKNCIYLEWKKGWKNHSGPLTSSTLLFEPLRLVDATELWAPERPDTETVSSLKQSISWTRDIKRGTHNTIIFIIHTHTYFLFQVCTYQTCAHNCLYYILCFCHFVHCLFVYFIICVLSCCTVELLSL